MQNIILDLCGGTGSWSNPWVDAGYTVYNITLPDFDVTKVSLKDGRYFEFLSQTFGKPSLKIPVAGIYGILATPPCTMFSDARTNAKTPRDLRGGMEVVNACLYLIQQTQYRTNSDQQKTSPLKFWALENPWYGRLKWFLGYPVFTFNPWEFGDAYKKKTALWGYFQEPMKTHSLITDVMTKKQIMKSLTNSQKLPKLLHASPVDLQHPPMPKFDYMASKDIHPEAFGKFDRQTRRSITPRGFALAFYEANKERTGNSSQH